MDDHEHEQDGPSQAGAGPTGEGASAADVRNDVAQHNALPPKVESWRRRSVTGAILTGFAFGLREVLEPERDEPAIVMQVSGEPVKDLAVEADLDQLHPGDSVVTVRRWLLEERQGEDGPTP